MADEPPNPSISASAAALDSLCLDDKFERIRSVAEDLEDEDELRRLLATKPNPVAFDGFEPSGRMHIAEGILKAINVKQLISAGCTVKLWVADYFALLNNKMGADLKKIQTVGKYMIEIWKAMGLDCEKVEFLVCSEEINRRPKEYWERVLDIATRNSVARMSRCSQIMGVEKDELTAGQIFYPCMQCADVFFVEADICQMGMDQRSVNELAREYCDVIKRESKPIILSHHMLPGLQQGQEKMSKSDPSSAIFMDDDEAEVHLKIKKAYCPPKIVEGNPCLEYIKYILFPWFGFFEVLRKAENGGNKKFDSMLELIVDYESGALHPADVKPAISKALNQILQPVRDHFKSNSQARDLLKTVKAYKITRTAPSLVEGTGKKSAVEAASTESLLLDASTRLKLEENYKRVRSVGEECIQEQELHNLLAKKQNPVCYDGFEPSGRMHIAQGAMKAINVNKLTESGCTVKMWIADWFAQLNNKMGGDLKKIQTVGRYLIEIWKAIGMNLEKVDFLWCSDEINNSATEYWKLVMDIARRNTLTRITRCSQIMGRSDQDDLTAAQIFYPCMQCADVFFLKADICQLGMDQRKVNVLAREYCDDIKRKNKPIILSHHMLPGLKEGQEKMSKSDPSSSIYMEDEEAEVDVKIENAYCPPKIVDGNPCLEYLKYIIFPWFDGFEVARKTEVGGDKKYNTVDELIVDYENGALHPEDLKPALAKALNQILQPVRDHFKSNSEASDLLKTVKEYRVTR